MLTRGGALPAAGIQRFAPEKVIRTERLRKPEKTYQHFDPGGVHRASNLNHQVHSEREEGVEYCSRHALVSQRLKKIGEICGLCDDVRKNYDRQ